VLDLQDRLVLVTRASRGVGRGIASLLAESGARAYATGRTAELLTIQDA